MREASILSKAHLETWAGWSGLIGTILMFTGIVPADVGIQAIETTTVPSMPARMMNLVNIAAPTVFSGL